ncbi:hypothetical protein K466DRAFT_270973 [Polyporus arcularius HHB13444]|uniref:Uncharacterized protein n=1 Tax=Polyporus arcularius HHB13444 TaxID=1314778 RepID=A0A5C3P1Q1_9APHY|nr:hypothetical protein K466DRAFT_270973 [Polyporus arcularius HHB13444]
MDGTCGWRAGGASLFTFGPEECADPCTPASDWSLSCGWLSHRQRANGRSDEQRSIRTFQDVVCADYVPRVHTPTTFADDGPLACTSLPWGSRVGTLTRIDRRACRRERCNAYIQCVLLVAATITHTFTDPEPRGCITSEEAHTQTERRERSSEFKLHDS